VLLDKYINPFGLTKLVSFFLTSLLCREVAKISSMFEIAAIWLQFFIAAKSPVRFTRAICGCNKIADTESPTKSPIKSPV